MKKAVSLISGGLDSLLATKIIQDQGIYVEGINFFTGFNIEGNSHIIRNKKHKKPPRNNVLWVAEQLNIKLHIIDVVDEYKDVLLNPKHGYGANMNPCLDCKIFMVNQALQWIKQHNFDFIITGEVVGQRPMSQRKDTMPIIANSSEAHDLLVRPLCAKNLPMTKPEVEGWIDREKLHNFSGRNRKPQMALASDYGFVDYATPGGGCCFLTDKNYSDKLIDLWQFRDSKQYAMDDLMLLKVGRHIRPKQNFKLIVAREESESNFLSSYRKKFISMDTADVPGPVVLIDGDPSADDLIIAARISARFSKARQTEKVKIKITFQDGDTQLLAIKPMKPYEVPEEWYI